MRTMDKEVRSLLERKIKQVIAAAESSFDVEITLEWIAGPPPTDNDKELTRFAWDVAVEQGLTPVVPEASMVGEDFAFYQERIKGFMAWVGVGGEYSLHSPMFQADSAAISIASDYFVRLCMRV